MINKFHLKLAKDFPEYSVFFSDYMSGLFIKQPNVNLKGTEFERRVLEAVCAIPYGQTRSYAQIAEAVGKPKAVRAVASAVARNKLLIVIPCHRVIRTDGNIGKYRAGTQLKKMLLNFELQNSKEMAQT